MARKFKIRGKSDGDLRPMLVCELLDEGGYKCIHYEHSEDGEPKNPSLVFTNDEIGAIDVTSEAPAGAVALYDEEMKESLPSVGKLELSW